MTHIRTRHQQTHKDPDRSKVFKCELPRLDGEICQYQTDRKKDLTRHQQTTSAHKDLKESSLVCEKCKQRFGQAGNLMTHIRKWHSQSMTNDI